MEAIAGVYLIFVGTLGGKAYEEAQSYAREYKERTGHSYYPDK